MPTLNFRTGTIVNGIALYENSAFCANTPIPVRYHGATYYADTVPLSDYYGSYGYHSLHLSVRIPGQSEIFAIAPESRLHPIAFQAVNARLGFPLGQPDIGSTAYVGFAGYISDGLTFSGQSFRAVVIGVDHNIANETNGRHCVTYAVMKDRWYDTNIAIVDSDYDPDDLKKSGVWFNHYNTHTNTIGWKGSNLRNNIMTNFYNAMEQDARNVVITTKKWTYASDSSYSGWTDNTFFLMSEFEMYGKCYQSNSAEADYQQRYAYYDGIPFESTEYILYKHNDLSKKVTYWFRSPHKSNSYGFVVFDDTDQMPRNIGARRDLSIVPCFNVG